MQLLVQVPIQVVLAVLLRRPRAEAGDAGGNGLAPWAVPDPAADPPRKPLADAEARPASGIPLGTARAWYATLAGVLAWLALLFGCGYPLLLGWVPLGPQRTAKPSAEPSQTVHFLADPGRRYLLYEDRTSLDGSESCRFDFDGGSGSSEHLRPGTWVWSRPPAAVTWDGRVFQYLGVVSGMNGVFDMSCDTGTMLVEDSPVLAASSTGPIAAITLSLPVLGIGLVAGARRHARRRQRRRRRPTPTPPMPAGT